MKNATMKAAALAITLLAVMPVQAHAGPCDQEIKTLDEALTRSDLKPDVKAELEDMRSQAEKLCAAGNAEEAADVLSEASSIIAAQ